MQAEVLSSTGPADIAPELRDGYEVHKAALRRGLDVLMLPRQVMMAGTKELALSEELSFVHGVPRTSSLSAVTFAQDKRMRRALLTHAGLPIPKGGVYSVGRGMEYATRLIERIGYPVVVKPAVGDNTIESRTGLRSEADLEAAIDYLRTPTAARATFTRAAYALTMLAEPEEGDDGRVLMPSSYRFLVEKHVSGEYLRFLVVGGEVCSAVHCLDGPWGAGDDGYREVTAQTHPSLRQLALDAAAAVPGLAIAAVDIVTEDHTRGRGDEDTWIVEVSERPWLSVQRGVSPERSAELGETILTRHADELSFPLAEPADDVSVGWHIEGLTTASAAVTAIVNAGKELGLRGRIAVTDSVEGVADGVLRGTPGALAWLAETLIDGRLDGHRAMLVEQSHRPAEELPELVSA